MARIQRWALVALATLAAAPVRAATSDAPVAKPSDHQRTAALVVRGLAGTEGRVAVVRSKLSETYNMADDPQLRALLESNAAPETPEKKVRDALERARQRLRVFDLAGVRQILAEARISARGLSADPTARRLAAEVAVRDAAAALVQKDHSAAMASMRFAIAADPALRLDASREPPPLLALLEEARAGMARATVVALKVNVPEGTQLCVWAQSGEGPTVACFPASPKLEVPEGPVIVWATHPGFAAQANWIEAHAGGELSVTLDPVNPHESLRPLVQAVRDAEGDARAAAAVALASALKVDVIAVLDTASPDAPSIYGRPDLSSPGSAPPIIVNNPLPETAPMTRAWYQSPWPWVGAGVGVAAVVVVVVLAVTLAGPPPVNVSCCR